jgi:hypothetical protein
MLKQYLLAHAASEIPERTLGMPAEGNEPLATALAENANHVLVEVDLPWRRFTSSGTRSPVS